MEVEARTTSCEHSHFAIDQQAWWIFEAQTRRSIGKAYEEIQEPTFG